MNDIMKVFENSEFGQLEVLWKDGKAYFPAIHCAEVLGYTNPRKAVLDHCQAEGVTFCDVVTKTTNQYGVTTDQTVSKKFITEGNLYRLIIRSKLELAQRFERFLLGFLIYYNDARNRLYGDASAEYVEICSAEEMDEELDEGMSMM